MSESDSEPEAPRPIAASDYVAPILNKRAFHCPHCGVYAPQYWTHLEYTGRRAMHVVTLPSHVHRGECSNCERLTYWIAESVSNAETEDPSALLVFPAGSSGAPSPHPDMPPETSVDYEEARGIVDRSPRGAGALLRLALQKLCAELGQSGKNLDQDVAALVRGGLSPGVQKALDALRVVGNNAVHPGRMDLRDDRLTATALFGLMNYIVEQTITRPKELDAIYGMLPESARARIAERDAAGEA